MTRIRLVILNFASTLIVMPDWPVYGCRIRWLHAILALGLCPFATNLLASDLMGGACQVKLWAPVPKLINKQSIQWIYDRSFVTSAGILKIALYKVFSWKELGLPSRYDWGFITNKNIHNCIHICTKTHAWYLNVLQYYIFVYHPSI